MSKKKEVVPTEEQRAFARACYIGMDSTRNIVMTDDDGNKSREVFFCIVKKSDDATRTSWVTFPGFGRTLYKVGFDELWKTLGLAREAQELTEVKTFKAIFDEIPSVS
jgi:hypothetical protein